MFSVCRSREHPDNSLEGTACKISFTYIGYISAGLPYFFVLDDSRSVDIFGLKVVDIYYGVVSLQLDAVHL